MGKVLLEAGERSCCINLNEGAAGERGGDIIGEDMIHKAGEELLVKGKRMRCCTVEGEGVLTKEKR